MVLCNCLPLGSLPIRRWKGNTLLSFQIQLEGQICYCYPKHVHRWKGFYVSISTSFYSLTRHNGKVMWGLPNLTWVGAKTYYLQDYFAKFTQFVCKSTWKLLCKGACTCHYAHFSEYLNIWIHLLMSPNPSHAFA